MKYFRHLIKVSVLILFLLLLSTQAARLLALLALQACARPQLLASSLPGADPREEHAGSESTAAHTENNSASSPSSSDGVHNTSYTSSGSSSSSSSSGGQGVLGSYVPVFEGGVGWRWWLSAAAASEDCWLSSHATKVCVTWACHESVLDSLSCCLTRNKRQV